MSGAARRSQEAGAGRKVVLVTRMTRLRELIARHNTLAQARFYVEHLGADFGDYVAEHEAYESSLKKTIGALEAWGRYQTIDRSMLPNYVFAVDDIVVALGQDGLVANTMKYLCGQPLIGVNPEPTRWDGLLLPFQPDDLSEVIGAVAANSLATSAVTMAEATLSDGQKLRAVNDLFIGSRSHTSALYEISYRGKAEFHSSSGLIVSTGLGSTAWLKSVVSGSIAIANAVRHRASDFQYAPMAWNTDKLAFAVREPFPTRATQTNLVYGTFGRNEPLKIRSRMPDSGVIFSDGIESDFLRFTAGMEATITLSAVCGNLIVQSALR